MPENLSNWIGLLSVLLCVAVYGIYMVRLIRNRQAPVRTVKAEVIDKFKQETFSTYQGSGKSVRYVIVFLAEGKKHSFYVSEFSYGGYRVKERGTLKYKGDRIIDFS